MVDLGARRRLVDDDGAVNSAATWAWMLLSLWWRAFYPPPLVLLLLLLENSSKRPTCLFNWLTRATQQETHVSEALNEEGDVMGVLFCCFDSPSLLFFPLFLFCFCLFSLSFYLENGHLQELVT